MASPPITVPDMSLNSEFVGIVRHVHSPHHVFITPRNWDSVVWEIDEYLSHQCFDAANGSNRIIKISDIKADEMCAKYVPGLGTVRGKFTGKQLMSQGEPLFEIKLIDFGRQAYYRLVDTFRLDEEYLRNIPPLIYEASIIGCVPVFDEGWDEEDIEQLEDEILEKTCEIKIIEKIDDKTGFVTMKLEESGKDVTEFIIDAGIGIEPPKRSIKRRRIGLA